MTPKSWTVLLYAFGQFVTYTATSDPLSNITADPDSEAWRCKWQSMIQLPCTAVRKGICIQRLIIGYFSYAHCYLKSPRIFLYRTTQICCEYHSSEMSVAGPCHSMRIIKFQCQRLSSGVDGTSPLGWVFWKTFYKPWSTSLELIVPSLTRTGLS